MSATSVQLAPPTAAQPRQANFDRVARLYRWAEYLFLGPLLTRTRNHFLPQLTAARHALVLGDGDGRFLARLLRQEPHLEAIAVDTSVTMLELLRRRCAFAGTRLDVLQASATSLPQALDLSQTDLIVTHFFLDCLTDVELTQLAQGLASAVPQGCRWVVSDFSIPQRQPWRSLGRVYIRLLYFAFRVLTGLRPQTLPHIQAALQAAGFHSISRAKHLRGLLYSELWER